MNLHGVSFLEYEAVLKMRGDRSVPRITYLRGELELMTPSRYHESDKKRFARPLEAWAEETGTELFVRCAAEAVRALRRSLRDG